MRRTSARHERRVSPPAVTAGSAESDAEVPSAPSVPPRTARERILDGAFVVLRQHGYAAANTRAIAAQAGVSKRELYREFGNKDGILGALIAERAARMRRPFATAEIGSRDLLAGTLRQVGVALLRSRSARPPRAVSRITPATSAGSAFMYQAAAAGMTPP